MNAMMTAGSLVLLSAAAFAQVQSSALTVPGRDGQAPVIQHNGRSYVEVESLARITGATLGFQGSRVVLTLPAALPTAPASHAADAPQTKPADSGYTREFLQAGVEQMTVIREWRSAIENAVRTNNPVEQTWISGYRRNADSRMQMATASAASDADRQGLALLQGAMSLMQQMSGRFLGLRSSLTFVPTDALDNDPVDQKILACAQGMAAQAVPGGKFEDVASCH
ncbi:MAG: hypothetical protein PW789_11550 [Edaphobacter sp.]|uniref:hypothetical protein n=1 Tax=Edaphobacter sp. TaxID=1934404 RepID=UPI00239A9A28|nr:hypothetical protein [Edaphobacter sp.]MDE1177220.1 hypothetical protein [Edaphobacter sp.]